MWCNEGQSSHFLSHIVSFLHMSRSALPPPPHPADCKQFEPPPPPPAEAMSSPDSSCTADLPPPPVGDAEAVILGGCTLSVIMSKNSAHTSIRDIINIVQSFASSIAYSVWKNFMVNQYIRFDFDTKPKHATQHQSVTRASYYQVRGMLS